MFQYGNPFAVANNNMKSPSRQPTMGLVSPKQQRMQPNPYNSNFQFGPNPNFFVDNAWGNSQYGKENFYQIACNSIVQNNVAKPGNVNASKGNNTDLNPFRSPQKNIEQFRSPVRPQKQNEMRNGFEGTHYLRTENDYDANSFHSPILRSPSQNQTFRYQSPVRQPMQARNPNQIQSQNQIPNQTQTQVSRNFTREQALNPQNAFTHDNLGKNRSVNSQNNNRSNNSSSNNMYHYYQQQALYYQKQMEIMDQFFNQQQKPSQKKPQTSPNESFHFIPQELENQPKDQSIMLSPRMLNQFDSQKVRVKIHPAKISPPVHQLQKEFRKPSSGEVEKIEEESRKESIEEMFKRAVQRSTELSTRIKEKEKVEIKELPKEKTTEKTLVIEGNYEGDLSETGIPNGKGRVVYHSKEVFEGEWKNGLRHGFGILYNKKGQQVYVGDWENDFFHGQGVLSNHEAQKNTNEMFDFSDFSKVDNVWTNYEGEFKEGLMDGLGILYLSSGERYNGGFSAGKIHGQGSFQKKNGALVMGQWENDKLLKVL